MSESTQTTHKRLGAVRSKNTRPELMVRSFLHENGYRFRVARKDLPGKPDIVLPKHHSIVFVNGCFWHRHEGCKGAADPKKNKEFWNEKFENNINRDKRNHGDLKKMGWRVIIVWECEVTNNNYKNRLLNDIQS